MKNKIIYLTLAILIIITAFPLEAYADGDCGKGVSWSYNSENATITVYGSGHMDDWSDFSFVPWRELNSEISGVVVESGVTTIGDWSFSLCDKLTTVNIQNGVETIGTGAFFYSKLLETLIIPKSLQVIEKGAFLECSNLKTVYYEGDSEDWEKISISDGNAAITDAEIVFGYNIGDGNLSGFCSENAVWSFDVLTGELSIMGSGNIESCPWNNRFTDIQAVNIADGITGICPYAFDTCINLVSVSLPSTLETIGNDAFHSCISLKTLDIPTSLINVGNDAFRNCVLLANVNYNGSEEAWNSISFESGNDIIKNCEVKYTIGGLYGDANGDGAINGTDLTLLAQHFAGWSVTICNTADANGDGAINGTDLTLLAQYFAGWGVVLGGAK